MHAVRHIFVLWLFGSTAWFVASSQNVYAQAPALEAASIEAAADEIGFFMTLPFIIAALFAKPFLSWMARHRDKMAYVEKIMGVMLIIFAILIATNTINLIAAAMIRWFPSFSSIG